MKVESWGPLAEAKHDILKDEMLKKIADKYNKTVAQVILRWHLEQGIIIIPKSVRKERMEENLDVHDFSLDKADMEEIAALDGKYPRIVDYNIMDIVTGMNSSKTPE